MKSVIRYISLLLYSGLILPFYNNRSIKIKYAAAPTITKQVSAVNNPRPANSGSIQYFLYQDVVEMLFPQPKN
jgi:hypothetical protein